MPLLTRDAALKLLGVSAHATEDECRQAWRALALRYHPDKNGGDEEAAQRFREATEAYKMLARADDACKSYEELCADNELVRQALSSATELNARLNTQPSPPSATDANKVLKVGAATWVGVVEGGRPHGLGDLMLPNGAVHHGVFEAGRACGEGILYEVNGTVTRGRWLDNKRAGAFRTTDPKGGLWNDVYDEEGKRTARKKAAPAESAPRPALMCRHCGVKFHAADAASFRCRQHSGAWVAAPTHNADGTAAVVDVAAFPEGGLWLCCGSKSKAGGDRCTLGLHASEEAAPAPAAPESLRLEARSEVTVDPVVPC